ncbi:MAG: ACT domain-containing protein [Propionibacteriales bacterium]|nr:ACT domain-containing protein [Propionibacteriales bacterium]
MSHLLRIALPDIPGSLGAVATALGMAGANIDAIEIVEHRQDGTAIDDVFLDFTPGVMPDMVVSAVQRLEGVHVMWISRYAAGGNLHHDLEAIEVITQDPSRVMERLADVLPYTFRSDWAMVVEHPGDRVVQLAATRNAPHLPATLASWFPMHTAQRPAVDPLWEGWSDCEVAAVPAGSSSRIVMFGRHGGPEILDSELARLNHLVAVAATIQTTVEALS